MNWVEAACTFLSVVILPLAAALIFRGVAHDSSADFFGGWAALIFALVVLIVTVK